MMQSFHEQTDLPLEPVRWGAQLILGNYALNIAFFRRLTRLRRPRILLLNRVAALRKERGLSLKALADALSISPSTLAELEAGLYLPSLALALAISEFFAMPVETLFCSSTAKCLC